MSLLLRMVVVVLLLDAVPPDRAALESSDRVRRGIRLVRRHWAVGVVFRGMSVCKGDVSDSF